MVTAASAAAPASAQRLDQLGGIGGEAEALIGGLGAVIADHHADQHPLHAAGAGEALGLGQQGGADAEAARLGPDVELGDIGVVALGDIGRVALEGQEAVAEDGALPLGDQGMALAAGDPGLGRLERGDGRLAVAQPVAGDPGLMPVEALKLLDQGLAVGRGRGAQDQLHRAASLLR